MLALPEAPTSTAELLAVNSSPNSIDTVSGWRVTARSCGRHASDTARIGLSAASKVR